jgi:hypothetical protein
VPGEILPPAQNFHAQIDIDPGRKSQETQTRVSGIISVILPAYPDRFCA